MGIQTVSRDEHEIVFVILNKTLWNTGNEKQDLQIDFCSPTICKAESMLYSSHCANTICHLFPNNTVEYDRT